MAKSLIMAGAVISLVALLAGGVPDAQAQLMRLPGPPLMIDPIPPDSVLIDDGRIPILEPTTITQPGHYFLARDLTVTNTAIDIQSDDVTLDLNGMTIRPEIGICFQTRFPLIAFNGSRIIIRNGRLSQVAISDMCDGVSGAGDYIRVEQMHIMAIDGIVVSNSRDVEVSACTYQGLTDFGRGLVIHSDVGNITNNRFYTDSGVQLWMSHSRIRGNHFFAFADGDGTLFLDGSANLVRDNTIVLSGGGAAEPGISITAGSGTLILKNVLKFSGVESNGTGNRIQENVISDAQYGIWVRGANDYVQDNLIYRSNDCAIYFENGSGHLYGGNVGSDNGNSSAFCSPPPGTIDLGGNVGL